MERIKAGTYTPLAHAFLVGASYYAGTKLGLALTPASFPLALIWPPNAILFAVFLIAPHRCWWLYLMAVFPAHMIAQFESGIPLLRSIGWYFSNTSEALLGAYCLRQFYKGSSWFDTLDGVGLFILFGGLIAPLITSFLDAGVVAATGWESRYWNLWSTRLLSNILSNMTIVPAITIAGLRGISSFRQAPLKRFFEATLLVSVVIVTSYFLFRMSPFPNHMFPVYLLPPFLWAAVRFGPGAVSACILALALVSSWKVVVGLKPLTEGRVSESLFSLHLFLIVISVTLMALAAVLQERRQVLKALLESEDQMNLAVSSANLGFYRYDLPANEIWLSIHCREMLGLKENDSVDRGILHQLIHPNDRSRVVKTFDDARDNGNGYEIEYPLVLSGGQIRWVNDRGQIKRDAAGRMLLISGVILDVTERKTAESEAQERLQELKHLSRVSVLGQLSGSLAHELNQPLTSILSNAQAAQRFLAQNLIDPEELRDIFADIVEQDKRAGAVIQRLRSLMMKEETKFQSLDANEVVTEILNIAHSDLIKRNVTVKTDLEPFLPKVSGDPIQLQQVVLNLVMNACESMEVNQASDRNLRIFSKINQEGGIQISFQDSGSGIAIDQLERIFEPFITTKPQGLGLGLAISHSIISSHGGRLSAANNANGGATFDVSLPAEKVQ